MKFLILFLCFALSGQASVCDCTAIKGFKEADIVFKGKVLKVQRIEEPYRYYEITFQVSKWMKGKKRKQSIVIDTPCLVDGCCGISFHTGEVYKVYAFKDGKRLETNQCWETHKIN